MKWTEVSSLEHARELRNRLTAAGLHARILITRRAIVVQHEGDL